MIKQELATWTWETRGRFTAGGEGSCGEQCPRSGRPRPATAHSTLIPETMMVGWAGALKPGPAGHRRCHGGCGLDRAGPADPLFHHRNERQRVAVPFQINELPEKAYSPRDRKERTQGAPRSLDQRRNSEKKLSQHLTETPSCEGPRGGAAVQAATPTGYRSAGKISTLQAHCQTSPCSRHRFGLGVCRVHGCLRGRYQTAA